MDIVTVKVLVLFGAPSILTMWNVIIVVLLA